MTLVLASGSPYKCELLGRLRLPFSSHSPDIDESARPHESPGRTAQRLAIEKARRVAVSYPDHWIIGADQAAELDGGLLGKPGSLAAATAQLRASRGRSVRFHTAVCLYHHADGITLQHCDLTEVRFRPLTDAEIERYLAHEPALDCAGSFKCEGLGISLFDAIQSQDPTALVGLPLIALARMLRQAGFQIP